MVQISKALEKQTDLPREGGATGVLDYHLYMYHMPYSYTAEQIRKIRTHIFHVEDRAVPRVIMITSAVPGEGKSVIAANLAIAIAKGEDQHVLLVECDLRKPRLHTIFKFPPGMGLSEIVQGKADLESCLIKTPIDKLTILPAAQTPPANPSELLESQSMRAIIQEVGSRYADRFVIIDTPPIQATVDPRILADQVDGILFVARHRHTGAGDVRSALASLPQEKVIGTVLNGMSELPSRQYKYKRYSYNKYYHSAP